MIKATIRENILFGRNMNYDRYGRVVELCELKEEFSFLSRGDETEYSDNLHISSYCKLKI